MSTTPQFEIPTDMRKMTEQSMEQVRAAINGYLQFFQRGVPSNVMGSSELSNKVFGYAERNVASAFEFAQRLVQVRDFQSLTTLQMEFIQAQMQAMTEQAKDLSETATKALMDSRKNPDKGRPIVLITGGESPRHHPSWHDRVLDYSDDDLLLRRFSSTCEDIGSSWAPGEVGCRGGPRKQMKSQSPLRENWLSAR